MSLGQIHGPEPHTYFSPGTHIPWPKYVPATFRKGPSLFLVSKSYERDVPFRPEPSPLSYLQQVAQLWALY